MDVLSGIDILQRIVKLIGSAKSWLMLVTPYSDFYKVGHVVRAIEGAAGRGVSVAIVIRSNADRSTDETEILLRLRREGVDIKQIQDLHAKIYASESEAFVTSMNLTNYSATNSLEIGLHFTSRDEARPIREFLNEKIKPELKDWELKPSRPRKEPAVTPPPAPPASTSSAIAQPLASLVRYVIARATGGFCIRCATEIDHDPSKPYCLTHYREWAEYENRDYVDKFCHACGKAYGATMAKPLCKRCFSRG